MNKKSYLGPIFIIGILFFIFGFITWLNSILIPYLKIACELSNFAALLVAFAFYISYFVMALPSSWILEKTGFKSGMSLGLIVMAFGSALFIPAAYIRFYPLFLIGLFIQGTGLALLQTATNPFVTILGPLESAAKRISIMGICNKIAGAISPLILGALVLKDSTEIEIKIKEISTSAKDLLLDELALRVVLPYLIISVSLLLLAFFIYKSSLPKIGANQESSDDNSQSKNERPSVFDYKYLNLGVIALFLYVGTEVIAGDTIINYGRGLNIEPFNINLFSKTINLKDPNIFTTYTLIGMLIGYIIGIVTIPKYISQSKALSIFALLGIIFTFISLFTKGFTSALFIALLGLANSMMWPAIWPLSIDGLGKHIKKASALLIMAIAGGAILPLIYGLIADNIGTHYAYSILIPCYLFILFFAVKGHKIGKSEF